MLDTWQSVPGTEKIRYFPLISGADGITSSTLLIDAPNQILLIDPGCSHQQMEQAISLIQGVLELKQKPVLIYLTHCHLDHVSQLTSRYSELKKICPFRVIAHEVGARALESGDRKLMLADLMGFPCTPFPVDFSLFKTDSMADETQFDLGNGTSITLHFDQIKTDSGQVLSRQTISLGDGEVMEVFHTPGHSPDSISLKIGQLLVIGDLLFATNPSVAGVYGWNHLDLIDSVSKVAWLFNQGAIQFCWVGHGAPIPIDTCRNIQQRVIKDAQQLGDIEEVNKEWVHKTIVYTEDLLQEISELFSIIAGRIYTISYRLEQLEEFSESQRYQELLEVDTIDEFLTKFNQFVINYHNGQGLELHVLTHGLILIKKIHKLMATRNLGSALDESLLRRVERLLNDFQMTIRGLRIRGEICSIELYPFIKDLISSLKTSPFKDQQIIDLSDDDDAYLSALATRLAYLPLFKEIDLHLIEPSSKLEAWVEIDRLRDVLSILLEECAVAGKKKVDLSIDQRGSSIEIHLSCPEGMPVLNERRIRILNHQMEPFKGNLVYNTDKQALSVQLNSQG